MPLYGSLIATPLVSDGCHSPAPKDPPHRRCGRSSVASWRGRSRFPLRAPSRLCDIQTALIGVGVSIRGALLRGRCQALGTSSRGRSISPERRRFPTRRVVSQVRKARVKLVKIPLSLPSVGLSTASSSSLQCARGSGAQLDTARDKSGHSGAPEFIAGQGEDVLVERFRQEVDARWEVIRLDCPNKKVVAGHLSTHAGRQVVTHTPWGSTAERKRRLQGDRSESTKRTWWTKGQHVSSQRVRTQDDDDAAALTSHDLTPLQTRVTWPTRAEAILVQYCLLF